MSWTGQKDRKTENETKRLIKTFANGSHDSPRQHQPHKRDSRHANSLTPLLGTRSPSRISAGRKLETTDMYTSRCSSGFGDAIIYSSSHMSTPSNSYDQQIEELEKKCLTIDKRLNDLETKLVSLVSEKGHVAKQRRRLQYSPSEDFPVFFLIALQPRCVFS